MTARCPKITFPLLIAVAFAGCGSEDDYANDPRPPRPIVVTASVAKDKVSVSPTEFGAGPITLIVTNQTAASTQVTLETDEPAGSAPGIRQQTAPINPRDTASLKADVREGTYAVRAGDGIAPAKLAVGSERESAQNDLLQP